MSQPDPDAAPSAPARSPGTKLGLGRILNILFLLLGVGLLVGMLVNLDTAKVASRMLQAGWYFLAGFTCYVASLFLSAYAWMRLVDRSRFKVSFGKFLAAFWAGHAINQLTPAASLGEVVKGTLLKDVMDADELVASIIMNNVLSTAVSQFVTMVAPLICLASLQLPTDVIVGLFVVATALCIPLVLLFFLLRWGVAGKAMKLLLKVPFLKIENPEAKLERARNVDRRIREFARRQPRDLAVAVACDFLVRVLSVAEIWLLLIGLLPDKRIGFLLMMALLSQSSSQLIAWVATFIPGQVGVMEGGGALLYKLVGLDPVTGFSMELLRRVRRILGIAVGLLIGLWAGIRPFQKAAEPAPEATALAPARESKAAEGGR